MQIFAAWFSFKGAIELAAILTENEEDHIKVRMFNIIIQSHCFPFLSLLTDVMCVCQNEQTKRKL